jgi:acyl-CoA hydrolase
MSASDFAAPATEAELVALAEKLRERNFEVVIVQDGAEAKAEVLKRIPEGAKVHAGKSRTLEDAGLFKEFMENERYDFVRRTTMKMDQRTQRDEMRKLGAAPDVMVNSAHAVTEAGQIVFTSASGSQIGPIASGAGKLILVIGSQKIVPDLDTAFRRIEEHVFPYEDARLREAMGVGTKITRTLILERDFVPGRTTILLVAPRSASKHLLGSFRGLPEVRFAQTHRVPVTSGPV